METYYSNGKLLISGEYLVLDGATSLALPTKYGQGLKVKATDTNVLTWKSYTVKKECWFAASFNLSSFEIIDFEDLSRNSHKVANTLSEILQTAKKLNSNFLIDSDGAGVSTSLTFPNEWGLGTSSTLINSIATWAQINAFELLEKSFGGSGYDIACAQNNHPITYKRQRNNPEIIEQNFNPVFKDQLFFVYLNEKQDSKEGIKMYRSLFVDKEVYIKKIDKLTKDLINSNTVGEFELLLDQHESIVSELLNIKPVKEKLFSDFKGAVKSLGAWGGDFVLVTGTKEYVTNYFIDKKYQTILSYRDMILD